jgi:signal transduction histidine kinase
LDFLIADALDGVWNEEGPKVTVDLPKPSPSIVANPQQLSRTMRNIVENAIRHTPPIGSVTITSESKGHVIVIAIADTGEGIPADHLDHIFDRFYRVDSSRNSSSGGTGLGLAICKSIIDAHGGRISIESIVGHGTTVKLQLPT